MAVWSQSLFLQALGWAMVNSLWQMALLLAGCRLLHIMPFSSKQKYVFAVGSLGVSLLWFVITFYIFYTTGDAGLTLHQHYLAPPLQTWNVVLSSVSLAYLVLLILPLWRFATNWRAIGDLKKCGLKKAPSEYRLFVKKMAQRLGINQLVLVYFSSLVQSPVTIGYLKPIILLPVAALNQLSIQQAEAVLLHELAHIRRYDYLINLLITILQTLLYFNPFVKKFVSLIELERENSCDELVLQFQYDKMSYASALLFLEKNRLAAEMLALGAAKNHLLQRVEKILDIRKKIGFRIYKLAQPLILILAGLFINALLVNNQKKSSPAVPSESPAFAFETPLYFSALPDMATFSKAHAPAFQKTGANNVIHKSKKHPDSFKALPAQTVVSELTPIAYDPSDALIKPEEKAHISQTIETTKAILKNVKWKEVEASIADGMTAGEKKAAKYEYLQRINSVNWDALEEHLKKDYNKINWSEINGKLRGALDDFKLDSIQNVYQQVLVELGKLQKPSNRIEALPVPDVSAQNINVLKNQLKTKIDSITILRERKIINF